MLISIQLVIPTCWGACREAVAPGRPGGSPRWAKKNVGIAADGNYMELPDEFGAQTGSFPLHFNRIFMDFPW